MSNKFSEMNLDKVSKSKRGLSRFLPDIKVMAFIILVIQIAILYFVLSPVNLLQQLNIVQVMNEVGTLTTVPPTEIPSVVAVIGDGKTLPDIETIKNENDYNAEVYKDAQNGDYVLAYTNSMIIYRRSTKTIIYNGISPVSIQTKRQTDLTNAITKIAKENGIISTESTEVPQLSIISDITKLQGSNAGFYEGAKNSDIVAIYAEASKILIYRPSTNSLVKSGNYQFNIK